MTQANGLRVLFVLYGVFRSNSAGHVAQFASRLAAGGCAVAVVGDGDPADMALHGPVNYHVVPRAECASRRRLEAAFGRRPWPSLVIHGWTPREAVRRTIAGLRKLSPGPTIIHQEDNEDAIVEAYLGRPVEDLRRENVKTLDRTVPLGLSHPLRAPELLRRADGVTAIVEKLLSLPGLPQHKMVLPPGAEIPPMLENARRTELRMALGLRPDECMIAYPGNMHPANRREVFELYRAIEIMNQHEAPTRLIRCGENHCAPWDPTYEEIRTAYSIDLGFVDRRYLLQLLASADVLVQPGEPGAFNDYRLPSKLPDFLASGRPVILPRTNLGLRLVDGVNAVLLDTGDADEIATKAAALLKDPARASAIGAAGRLFAEGMSWEAGASALLDFYKRAMPVSTSRNPRKSG